MSIHELMLMLEGLQKKERDEYIKMGMAAYFTGVASQMDFKKMPYTRWINQFRDQDELIEEHKKKTIEAKKIFTKLRNSNKRPT